jgi:hypothetical protein
MSSGYSYGNRPPLCENSAESSKVTGPNNIRNGNETVRTTQDYKKNMKSAEVLDDYR